MRSTGLMIKSDCVCESRDLLLKDGVHRGDASGHVLVLPLAVSVAGPALGDVVEQPFVLGVVKRR